MGAYLFGVMGEGDLFHNVWPFVRYSISFILMFVAFHLIYKYLPNRRLKSKNVLGGTVFTTFGWIAASSLFSFYVNNFEVYEKIYGSLGGIFALIVWLYMSTLIFLLGGEINAISSSFNEAETHGEK